jgi:hypothetical protein
MIHTRHSLTDRIRGELFPRDFGMGFSVAKGAKHKIHPFILKLDCPGKMYAGHFMRKKLKNNR